MVYNIYLHFVKINNISWRSFHVNCIIISKLYIIICMCACMHAQSLHSFLTLWDPMDCIPPGSSVNGILQVRILEWVAMPSCRGSSWPRDQTWISRVSMYMYMCVYSWNIYLGVLYLYIFIYKVYISSKYIYEVYIFRIFICMKCICMCYSQFGERIKGQRSMWNWSLERVCSLVRRGEWDGHLLLYSPIPVLKNGCKKNLTSWSLFIFP